MWFVRFAPLVGPIVVGPIVIIVLTDDQSFGSVLRSRATVYCAFVLIFACVGILFRILSVFRY